MSAWDALKLVNVLFSFFFSVPETESLFISKTRTEKMVQSFMYCSCLGQTLSGLSSEVDCSWKESQPVCPPLDMNKKSCSVRSKRSTDDEGDEESFDISAAEIAYIERPEVVSFLHPSCKIEIPWGF